jgi:hypothetical protein
MFTIFTDSIKSYYDSLFESNIQLQNSWQTFRKPAAYKSINSSSIQFN